MALNLENINYSGKEISDYIVRESFNTNTIATVFGAQVRESYKSTFVWHNTTIDLVTEAKTTCPDFSSDYTLAQNSADLCNLQWSGRIPNDALVGTYRENNLQPGVLNEDTTQDVLLFQNLVEMLREGIANKMGLEFMRGSVAYGSCQDGLIEQFEDDTLQSPVPSAQRLDAAASITTTNINTELDKVIAALPPRFRSPFATRPAKIAVSFAIYNTLDAYYVDKGITALGQSLSTNSQPLVYRGYEVIPMVGLDEREMFMTFPENITLVYDARDDERDIRIKNGLDDSSLCDYISWRVNTRGATLYGDGDAIVWYRPAA